MKKLSSIDRTALIRLASSLPRGETRRVLLSAILKVGTEFATKDALDAYLKEHPNADRSKHSIKDSGHLSGSKHIIEKAPHETTEKDHEDAIKGHEDVASHHAKKYYEHIDKAKQHEADAKKWNISKEDKKEHLDKAKAHTDAAKAHVGAVTGHLEAQDPHKKAQHDGGYQSKLNAKKHTETAHEKSKDAEKASAKADG